jgi:hypothetical protein
MREKGGSAVQKRIGRYLLPRRLSAASEADEYNQSIKGAETLVETPTGRNETVVLNLTRCWGPMQEYLLRLR